MRGQQPACKLWSAYDPGGIDVLAEPGRFSNHRYTQVLFKADEIELRQSNRLFIDLKGMFRILIGGEFGILAAEEVG